MKYTRAARPLFVETPLWDDQRNPMVPCLSVTEHQAVDTGLVFADGSRVMRVQPPIGFGRDKDW